MHSPLKYFPNPTIILHPKLILACCVSDKRRQEKVGEGELDGPVEKEEGKRGREREEGNFFEISANLPNGTLRPSSYDVLSQGTMGCQNAAIVNVTAVTSYIFGTRHMDVIF